MAIPGLQTSPRTKVFRAIVQILQRNQVLRTAIKPDSLRSWSGASHDTLDFTKASAPAIRLTPTNGPELWKFPDARVGKLMINCEMLIAGTNVDDVQDLWWAIERALYPDGNTLVNIPVLQAAGAYSGLVEFSQPAFDPAPEDKFFAAMGQMQIDVILQLTG